jgi:hypothetical protein
MARDLSRPFVWVQPNGCWLWERANSKGYGRIFYNGRLRQAHRLFYELLNGPVDRSLHLDHLCRTRQCVNPSHMEPVTQAVNLQRSPLMTPFTAADVKAIRDRAATGVSYAQLAREYGVTDRGIAQIVKRRSWKNAA